MRLDLKVSRTQYAFPRCTATSPWTNRPHQDGFASGTLRPTDDSPPQHFVSSVAMANRPVYPAVPTVIRQRESPTLIECLILNVPFNGIVFEMASLSQLYWIKVYIPLFRYNSHHLLITNFRLGHALSAVVLWGPRLPYLENVGICPYSRWVRVDVCLASSVGWSDYITRAAVCSITHYYHVIQIPGQTARLRLPPSGVGKMSTSFGWGFKSRNSRAWGDE